jgi:hypothetical protein
MTGRIYKLDHANTAGSIKGENGQIIPFGFSVVLAYDVACLGVGQLVTFELPSERRPHAVNVCIQQLGARPTAKHKRDEPLPLRYLGFDHQGSVRSYRFEQVTPGADTKTFTVMGELALFKKHHVGIQDGPFICLDLLRTQLASGENQPPPLNSSLADQDMLAYLARHPTPAAKNHDKRSLGTAGATNKLSA